ncbi:MAG: TIGR01777 family oxidoreductase [Rectinemataceae bacterium]
MKVVIAGGTGYVGRALVASFLGTGDEVLVLSRGGVSADASAGVERRPQALRWDGKTQGPWSHALDGADLVVNLSGERVAGPSPAYRWTPARRRLLAESRRDAGGALVEAIIAASVRPGVFIQASGIDYYPPGEGLAREGDAPGTGFLSRLAARDWEPSTEAVETLGVRRIVARLGPVLGSGSPVLAPLLRQHRLCAGGPVGSGRQWMSWVALADLVGGLRHLAADPHAQGAFNLVAPGSLRNAELSEALGRILHRPSWLPLPSFALRLAFGAMADTLLLGVRAEPRRLLDAGYSFRFPEIGAALEASIPDRR